MHSNTERPCTLPQTSLQRERRPLRNGISHWFAILAALIFLCAAPLAHAQFRASLRGTVEDTSGAVVPGATVTLINKDTNETKTSTSDGSGIYNFNALPPGVFM